MIKIRTKNWPSVGLINAMGVLPIKNLNKSHRLAIVSLNTIYILRFPREVLLLI